MRANRDVEKTGTLGPMIRLALLVLAMLVSSAHADEAVGWSFSVPKGASLQKQDDKHVIYLNITGKTFCMYALYPPRATTASFFEDEWKGIVVPSFTAKSPSKLVTTKTKTGLKVTSRNAAVTDKEGAAYATALYVLERGGLGGSVLLTSSNAGSLAKCPIQPLLASMSMLSPPPAAAVSAPPSAPTTTPAPAPAAPATAGQPALVGVWGTGAGNPASRYGTGSTMRRQYSFTADGTYTYRSEIYNGVNEWIIVRESGAFSVSGDQLTVEPKASTITSRDWKTVKSTKKQALEKVTYRFRMHYFSGIQEWNLVLTPPQPTERDGGLSTVWDFKDSYLLKSTYAPEWKWP